MKNQQTQEEVTQKNKTNKVGKGGGFVKSVGKWSKRIAGTFVVSAAIYAGGGKLADNKLPDRPFEQEVLKEKDSSDMVQYSVGGVNLGKIIEENQLNISPEKLYTIFQNEKQNKTKTLSGGFVSDVSDGIRKALPALWKPNHSFGTWQLQDRAFLDFMKNMSIKEKNDFVTKLASFTINGNSILKSCGYSEDERGDFITYILKGKYSTEDGDDNWMGRGNGKLGFAMAILMNNEIHNNTILNQNNLIEQQFGDNLAAHDLISENYGNGLANAYWCTNYVRASVEAPDQLDQNIKIIGLFLDDKITIEDIAIEKRGKKDGKMKLNMPDGDKGRSFKNNQDFIDQTIHNEDCDVILRYIRERGLKLGVQKKEQLAKLLLACSFETFYFGILDINNQSTLKNNDLIDNIINNKSISNIEIEEYIDNISHLEQPMLDRLIQYSLDALIISSHKDIRRTVPVIQSHYNEVQNEINTLARFSKGGGGIQIAKITNKVQDPKINNDSSLVAANKDSIAKDTVEKHSNINKEKKDYTKIETKKEEIRKVLSDNNNYKNIGTFVIKQGTQGRDIVWNNEQVKRHIIKSRSKDIDGKLITNQTDRSRLPISLIAQFLSTDGKGPIEVSKLSKFYIGERVQIILPK